MQDEITFADLTRQITFIFKIILKKIFILLAIGLVGGVAGAFYAYKSTPNYRADLVFVAQDNGRQSASGLLGLASQFGINIDQSNDAFSAKNMIGLLNSNKIVISALLSVVEINGRKDRLLNFYLDNYKLTEAFKENPKLKNLSFPVNQKQETFSRVQDSILLVTATVVKNGIIEVEKIEDNTDFFKITCISNNEDFSLFFSKQILNELVSLYTITKTKQSLQIVNLLENRADSIKKEYIANLSSRASTLDANLNQAFQLPLVNLQRKQTDITILATEYGEIVKNLELAKFNLMKDTPLVQVIDDPQEPLKRLKPSFLVYGMVGAFICSVTALIYFIVRQKKKQAKLKA